MLGKVRGLGLALAVAALWGQPAVAGNESSDDSFGGGFGGTGARPAAVARAAMTVTCPLPPQTAALREGMLRTVNQRRQAAGLVPLRHSDPLALAAGVVACDNARRGQLDHVTLAAGDLGARVRAVGYRFGFAAEALAYGYTSPERLAGVWEASAYHYPTLMTPRARETGIAVVQAADGRLWWAMISAQPR